MEKIDLLSNDLLWKKLKSTTKPIVMYGMGNGADKILGILDDLGVSVSDFFASDGFVRGHCFHGRRVLSFAEIREKYEDPIILLAFGSSRPEVLDLIYRMDAEHELYAPDVPVCGGSLFDADFYRAHEDKIIMARTLLADEESRFVYDAILRYKLSGKIAFLRSIDSVKEDALTGLLSGGYTAYVDLGAYTGDTIAQACTFFPTIRRVAAFEPSAKIFAKLSAFLSKETGILSDAFMLGAWNCHEIRSLTDGSGRNTTLIGHETNGKTQNGAKIHICECDAPDARLHLCDEKLLIKYDVEGAEKEAIYGSVRTIRQNETEMIVSLYHKSEDLFELPLLIHEILPEHKLYLRKHPYVPAWDINLYVKKP